ncbi:MAG: hypothetical protein MJ252_14425 [archaeon]|nr:hypothetical protein [archaeon]
MEKDNQNKNESEKEVDLFNHLFIDIKEPDDSGSNPSKASEEEYKE